MRVCVCVRLVSLENMHDEDRRNPNFKLISYYYYYYYDYNAFMFAMLVHFHTIYVYVGHLGARLY